MILSPEHLELRDVLHRWVDDRVAPHAEAVDAEERFPHEMWAAYQGEGWCGLPYPEEFGGQGGDNLAYAILCEELARVDASAALVAMVTKLGTIPILYWGSQEQKTKYVTQVATGEVQTSYCLSEADAGSDVASMRTRAVRDGDEYVLNGTKAWITNAGVSSLYTVFAVTDPDAGHRGLSAFIVEADWGVQVPKLEKKLGVRGSPTGQVLFEDVRVPAENLIGQEGDGFYIAMGTLDRSRPSIGAQAVGIAQGALDVATTYMHERTQFGKPIADFQGLQFMVADAATQIRAARNLVYEASAMIDSADPELTKVGAMCKMFASDMAMKVTTDCVQLLGGNGYTREYPVERMMRDAKITQIYEGTNQIQRVVISRKVLDDARPT